MMLSYFTLPPEQRPYRCGWLDAENVPCGLPVYGEQFSVHLRECHQVSGHDKSRLRCDWVGCGLVMNKESVVRHVTEMHLEFKHTCPICREVFSRKSTLHSHVAKKHAQDLECQHYHC